MMTYTTLQDHLTNRNLTQAKQLLSQLFLDEAAGVLRSLPPTEQALAYRLLEKQLAIDVFELLDDEEQLTLLEAMTSPQAVAVLSELDVDDAARLVDEAPAKVAKRLLAAMPVADRERVGAVLAYRHDSAGRLANPRYVAVRRDATAAEALAAVRASALGPEDVTTVFVIDNERHYQGLVSVAELVKAGPETIVTEMARLADLAVHTGDDAADAARLLQRRDLGALAVVDRERRLVGAVTFDDAMDTLEDEASETMYRKAGLGDPAHAKELLRSEKLTRGSIWYPVRVRIAFLMVTLVGGLAVGGVIDYFEDVLAAVVAVAIFVPLIMDMGGNVGTQSTTIFARGLALGHVDPKRFGRQLGREVTVGATMAVALATIGGFVAYAWQGAPNDVPLLGLAVGLSLFVSVTFATFLGFALPWLMVKIGLDHAPGADPFITTIKDFTGLAVYFLLVGALLGVG
ncbi:magnesium transporter [Natronosporangium hydrolyticum]|uniref:Magnesium transporter MgtE n=1 Tax=Natronosporangium hydrolyticum TaxID=2811111 RepID=A0A895YKM0_9ACTN|nr:magnesium transporter [Natronosporangium hydrolyticum]QSB16535.1 magnesium transporter [Natronosporangium hydrolyticum]